jgi:ribosomal protein L37AE/L43A
MDAIWMCPSCGQPEALIALGARRDYPHRWRWWVSTLTQLYLCDQCDALVALGAAQTPIVESTPDQKRQPETRAATPPYHRAHSV